MPKLLLRDIGGHDCQCPACSPGYPKQLEDKALRRIYKDETIELGEQTRKRVIVETLKVQADTLAKLRAQAKEEHVRILAEEEVSFRKMLADNEGKFEKDAYEEAKTAFTSQLTAEYRARVRAEVRKEIVAGLTGSD